MSPATLSRRVAGASLIVLAAATAAAQPYDDAALMRQMGFVAGQAVACGLDQPLVATAVTSKIIDGMGYDDEASRTLVSEGMSASEAEGCRPLSDENRKAFEQTWTALKRRAGL